MTTLPWRGLWQGRTPAGDVHRRAREIVRPTGGIVRGKFPSRKNGRMVHHEGLLELDAIYLFEVSPHIVAYREQPCTLQYPDGARLRRYTPDFEVVLRTDEVVTIEVKPRQGLQQAEVARKLGCVREQLGRSDSRFVVLDDEVIRAEPRLSNARWVYRQAPRIGPTPEAMRVALARCRMSFPTSIEKAETYLAGTGVDPYSLLLAGLLHCDAGEPMGRHTVLFMCTEVDDGWLRIAQEHGF
jgi:hypothetical protein